VERVVKRGVFVINRIDREMVCSLFSKSKTAGLHRRNVEVSPAFLRYLATELIRTGVIQYMQVNSKMQYV
jgi:hypothetical protein